MGPGQQVERTSIELSNLQRLAIKSNHEDVMRLLSIEMAGKDYHDDWMVPGVP